MILPKSFYNRPTIKVAQDLLGCFLIREFKAPLSREERVGEGPGEGVYKIVETEAYVGPNDLASHASQGRTERNKVMFGEPGIIYVYFTYGMHYMLNIVTERKEYPAAVLIRAVEPASVILERSDRISSSAITTDGPAKLTKTLKIGKSFNHLPIYTKKHGLWIETPPTPRLRRASRDEDIKPSQIVKTTRIGVNYAKEYKNKKWRFYIKGNKFVSKK